MLDKKTSIKVYRKQTHYNQWEFVFDPTQNALEATAGAPTNINGSTTGTGANGSTGSGFGVKLGFRFRIEQRVGIRIQFRVRIRV